MAAREEQQEGGAKGEGWWDTERERKRERERAMVEETQGHSLLQRQKQKMRESGNPGRKMWSS